MSLKVGNHILVIPVWTSDRARHYNHEEQATPVCLTCEGEPDYSIECERAGHAKRRQIRTTVLEDAPEETKRIGKLYSTTYQAFHKAGYACGRNVYLIPENRRMALDAQIADLRQMYDDANAEMKVCRADLYVKIVEIKPGEAHEETMRSIQRDVQDAIDKMIDALESGDRKLLQVTIRETKNLSQLLEGDSQGQVGELAAVDAGPVAGAGG